MAIFFLNCLMFEIENYNCINIIGPQSLSVECLHHLSVNAFGQDVSQWPISPPEYLIVQILNINYDNITSSCQQRGRHLSTGMQCA